MANTKDLKPKVLWMMNKLIERQAKAGRFLLVTQGVRTISEQNALYAQGRTKPGKIVTNAKGGTSFHNFGVAFDICFIRDKKAWYPSADPRTKEYKDYWLPVAADAKFLGLEWGDRGFVDLPHFQYRAGYSLEDFQKNRIDPKKFL